ncbi:MAG: GTPase Era [bacterium]|nr:GTPase Era [bacterium]
MKKCGSVTIMGRPNVGKSTLLNGLLNIHLAITTDKAGTTRNSIEGIYQDDESQIVFIDTPGIHKPIHKLGNVLNKTAYLNMNQADIILFMIDAKTGFGKGDQFILNKIKETEDVPVFLLLNKVDKIEKETLFKTIDKATKDFTFQEVIPISALEKDGLDDLVKTLKKYLPDSDPIFEDDALTNVSTKFIMAEFVREKAMQLTREEVPHAITCYVENYKETEDLIKVQVLIVVDRLPLKKIIIGKNGSMLKKIGTSARYEMEKFMGKKVYLETYVKVIENWKEEEKYLKEFGFENE